MVVQYNNWHTSEQARRVTNWRRERKWKMEELKNRQQQETGGQAAISLMPNSDGTHIHIFESLQLKGSCVRDLLCFSQ